MRSKSQRTGEGGPTGYTGLHSLVAPTSSIQPVSAIRYSETTKDLQSHVSIAGQNYWKEKEEILAKPHDSRHGHLMLACLSLSFCSCFPSAAQTLSAAT